MRIRLTVGLIALLAAPLTAQEAVQLRLGGRPGSSNRYVTTLEMFIRGGPMAGMMNPDTNLPMTRITMFATRTLTAVNGDTLTFSELIDSARFESPAMPQMAQMAGPMALAAINGSTTITKMDPSGQIFDIQTTPGPGAGNMGMQGPGGGPGGPGGRRGGPGGPMGLMGGNAGSRPMFGFPARPVRIGESWSVSDTMNVEQVTTVTNGNYRLERVDNQGGARVAIVSLSGNMDITTPGGPMNMTSTGELQMDLSNRRMQTMTMIMQGVMSNPQVGEMPMKMVMNMRVMQ